jgi:hypothetical protein
MGKDPLAPLTEGLKKSAKSDKATTGEFITFITFHILFSWNFHCVKRRSAKGGGLKEDRSIKEGHWDEKGEGG